MSQGLRPARTLLLLTLAAAIVTACTSGNDTPDPDLFDAGPAESYDHATITTFVDGIEVARTPLDTASPRGLVGETVLHLLRLESGEFRAFDARDTHSDCWVHWSTQPPETAKPGDSPGWFHDPCHGAVYNAEGARVFGPAPRGLDRYPVEIQDGRVMVALGDEARIPGIPSARSTDSNDTPTPVRTPSPTATPTGFLETSTPTPPTVWTAADLLTALEAQNIEVEPTGRTVACAEVNGLPGTEYDGDVRFVLWVYDSAEAVTGEWTVAAYAAQHPVLDCNRGPARIYPRDNMILWLPGEPPFDETIIEIADTFLSLGPRPLPSELYGQIVDAPATGAPFSTTDFLDAATAEGVSVTPYEGLRCDDGRSTAERQILIGDLSEAPSIRLDAVLLVYPSVTALESEWRIGVDGSPLLAGSHRQREPDCIGDARAIYITANLVLLTQRPPTEEFDARLIRAFAALTAPAATPTPVAASTPAATAVPAAAAPTTGTPWSAADLVTALEAQNIEPPVSITPPIRTATIEAAPSPTTPTWS